MKQQTPHRRAFAALVSTPVLAFALAAVPASAQTAQPAAAPPAAAVPAITPPPVVPTLPDDSNVTQGSKIGDPDSPTPVAPEAAAQAAANDAADAKTRHAPTHQAARAAPVAAPVHAAPVRTVSAAPAAVTPAPASAPVAETPVAETAPPATAPQAQPAPDTAAPAASTETQQTTTTAQAPATPIWPWLLAAAIIVIGAIGLFAVRRRRDADVYEELRAVPAAAPADAAPAAEPAYAAPAAAAPIAAAEPQFHRRDPAPADAPAAAAEDIPAAVAIEEATLAEPAAAEVESLTAGDAPVRDRPWLEFAMRPLRAGTNVDEALVEIELIVGNSGNIAAENVRISTFMFADRVGSDAEMDQLLIERGEEGGVAPVTIEAGGGTQVDATLAMPRASLDGADFMPVVVADARYTLPGGEEGRTSAAFRIGVSEDGTTRLTPIATDRPSMREDIAAALEGVPEHA